MRVLERRRRKRSEHQVETESCRSLVSYEPVGRSGSGSIAASASAAETLNGSKATANKPAIERRIDLMNP
jgi:hypothetical protein